VNGRLTAMAALATIAAALSLYPVVSGTLWLWEGIGAVLVAAGAGMATRLRALPAAWCAAAGLAALALYLNLVFAAGPSLGGVIPDRASLAHLWSLAGRGLTQTARFAPPAPSSPPILLLTVAGIGLVAVAVDLVAVRLRRPAAAGLPLLLLFCEPLTTSNHQGALGAMTVFALGMAAYLGMLAADSRERLRVWGRLVTVWHRGGQAAASGPGGPNTRDLAAAGRRIGLAAVVIGLFVPLLIPGLHNHKLFAGSSGGGGGLVALPDPLVQMNSDLRRATAEPVLAYRTSDPDPQYLQVYVLSNLSPQTWTMSQVAGVPVTSGNLPGPPGLARSTPARTEHSRITLARGLSSGRQTASFLPLPYPARTVAVPGTWHADPRTLAVFSGQSLSGLSYSATSREVSPSIRQLQLAGAIPGSIANNYLHVPAVFLPLARLAEQVTQGQTTSYGEAVALQRWFASSGKFHYSLSVSEPNTAQALIRFLTRDRRGYCQQFAFAMAVLARLLDIPARVAVGYTAGTPLGHGRWQVRTSDAHAWPELYFAGAGWLRFEPTPAGSDGQATARQPTYTLPPVLAAPGGTPVAPATAPSAAPTGTAPGGPGVLSKLEHLGGATAAGGGAHRTAVPVAIIVAALAAALLITPRAARELTRRRRWRSAAGDAGRAEAAWLELLDTLTDYRVSWAASESPRALARRVTASQRLDPGAAAALGRIAAAAERARYAREPGASGTVRADSSVIRRGVAARAGRMVRVAAWMLPASSVARARRGGQRMLEMTSRMDLAGQRMAHRLHPRDGRRGGMTSEV
jgi:TgpA N-terminal domain/Transglutaminase-like superfamily/Domain of unknown function (DUF4129)